MRPVKDIIIESLAVGVATLGLGFIIMLFPSPSKFMQQFREGRAEAPLVGCFFLGFIFHMLAEYTGINEWYVRTRAKAWE
tara:strand:+ start:5579 stop:5818 length:240 start_codon:yes stop_codon:yes gene_type:complete